MSTLKVLQLPQWAQHKSHECLLGMREDCLKHYPLRGGNGGRPGVYCRDDDAWMVLDDGRVFQYPIESFRFELAMLEVARYNHRQIAALQAVKAQGLATRKQKELLYHCQCAAEIRETGRRARRTFWHFRNVKEKA